jgi:alpha-glucosidase
MNDCGQPKEWSRRATVYQIYPRSFADSDGDGVGDLRGIIDRLDYLSDGTRNSLGIEALWLSPMYPSPGRDFGYDITDHRDIDSRFGDLGLFDHLVAEAGRRGIRILMDYIPNHTSDEHDWFRASRSSKDDPKRDWYVWRDPAPDGGPPNNWLSVFGGSAWELDPTTGQYYLHHHFPFQPDLNWRNPEVREAMLSVLRFWLDRGVAGFRTDAIYTLIEDPEFRDNPPNPDYRPGKDDPYLSLTHEYDLGHDGLYEAIGAMCEVLAEYEDAFMVSESYVDLETLGKLYDACRNGRHMPLNFGLISLPWDAGSYRDFIGQFDGSLEPHEWPNTVLGNHDRDRIADRVGRERARLLAIMQMTLRGMPFIYYGEELGMRGIPNVSHQRDPLEERVPGLGLGRDPERAPMQWDGSKHAGFTVGEPWLPVASDYERYNVAAESEDPHSFLSLYRHLIWHRKGSSALLSGKYIPVDAGHPDIFAYSRVCDDERVLVLLNFSERDTVAFVDFPRACVVASTHMRKYGTCTDVSRGYMLRGYEGLVLSDRVDFAE